MTIASVTTAHAAKTTAGAAPTGAGDAAGDLFAMLVSAFFPQLSMPTGDGATTAGITAGGVTAAATTPAAGAATAGDGAPVVTDTIAGIPVATPLAAEAGAGATTTPATHDASGATTVAPDVLAGLGDIATADPSTPAVTTPRTTAPTGEQAAAPAATDAVTVHAGDAPDPRLLLARHAVPNGHGDDHDADTHSDNGRHEGRGWAHAPGRAVSALATSGPRLQSATRHDQDPGDDDGAGDGSADATKPTAAVTLPARAAAAADDHDADSTTDLHVSGPSSVAATPRPAAVDAPAPTPPTAPTRPAEVPAHQQITTAVGGLRQRGDGTYHLNVHLHPADLGPVHLDVELHHDTIELHMHAEHEHARELLSDHITEIRRELEQLGLQATTVDVGDGSRRRQPMPAEPGPAPFTPLGSDTPAGDATPLAPVAAPSTSDSALDVRI